MASHSALIQFHPYLKKKSGGSFFLHVGVRDVGSVSQQARTQLLAPTSIFFSFFLQENWTPLLHACRKGHPEVVTILLGQKAKIEAKEKVCEC